jgi:hypothetical protein
VKYYHILRGYCVAQGHDQIPARLSFKNPLLLGPATAREVMRKLF